MQKWKITIAIATASLLGGTLFVRAQGAPDSDAIKKIERDLADSVLKHDRSAFEKHILKNASLVEPDGSVISRVDLLSAVDKADIKSLAVKDLKVAFYGTTAVAVYITEHTTGSDRELVKSRWTDTYVKLDGKWQIAASHGCSVLK